MSAEARGIAEGMQDDHLTMIDALLKVTSYFRSDGDESRDEEQGW